MTGDGGANTSQLPQTSSLSLQPDESSQQDASTPHSVDNELGMINVFTQHHISVMHCNIPFTSDKIMFSL